MELLVADVVQTDPSLRPDMDEVVRRFGETVQGLSSWKLRSRVSKAADIFGSYYSVPHWIRRLRFIVKRVPPIPVPS
ncbi:hypothetical protein B0H10DRAFT_2003065 [Mycena sp. CBHHK59/15]|nr:hypothetical protein B0H10DRAFT_2003065 [Mycena sp. CBHHK59/15]